MIYNALFRTVSVSRSVRSAFKILCLLVMSVSFVLHASAQTTPTDYSKIKVDQLSNTQLQDIYTKYQSSGMTENEFYNSLIQRGFPVDEIAKLRQRFATLGNNKNGANNGQGVNATRRSLGLGADNNGKVTGTDTLSELEQKVFGYRIFHNTSINFAPNLNMATPKSYVVGPGDALLVQVYGIAQASYTLSVSPEGNVTIPDIGMSHVGGFSIDAVKTIMRNKLATRYSGMNASPANTFIEVTLSNIRSIKVNIVGEIFKPGTYTLPSYTNIFNAIFAAGGPTVKGTFRNIQVYRANQLVGEIDLYDYIVNGKASQNIRLEDDDVIIIRPASFRIEIAGEVRTPGIFELKDKETFQDVLRYAGGFGDNAYKQMVYVRRRGVTENQVFDLPANRFASGNLSDGDLITVNQIIDRFTNRVQITGAINRPGAYELAKGMRIQDMIQKAGGLKGDAFVKRLVLYRTKADYSQVVYELDLSAMNQNDTISNILLQKEDVLSIPSLYDLKEEYYIQISGEVNNPGVFPFADSMTVGDILLQAGGFKYSASGSHIEIARRRLDVNNSNVDDPDKIAQIITINIDKGLGISPTDQRVSLKPFDHIFVRATPGYQIPKVVTVKGEVAYAGVYVIDKKEMRISDLLARAGGITKFAYTKGATLVRRTKTFDSKTPTEQENINLTNLKTNLAKDSIVSSSETNKEFSKRVNSKIEQNEKAVNTEKEEKISQTLKQDLLKNNGTLAGKNGVAVEEKDQELVAIDFDEILSHPGSTADLVLKEGDVLEVPEILETVRVRGGVLYPVSVRYEPGLGFREYVNRSGGFVPRAIRSRSYVLQANGKVEKVKTFLFFRSYPKVEPGAEIFIPVNTEPRQAFSFERAVGILTTTLTLIFLLRTL